MKGIFFIFLLAFISTEGREYGSTYRTDASNYPCSTIIANPATDVSYPYTATSLKCNSTLPQSSTPLAPFPPQQNPGNIPVNRQGGGNTFSNTRKVLPYVPYYTSGGLSDQNNYNPSRGSQNINPQVNENVRYRGNEGFRGNLVPTTTQSLSSRSNLMSANIKDFSWRLFKSALEQETENIVLSPVVVQFQLAILKMAAEGNTKKELERIASDISAEELKGILSSSDASSVLELANAIFIDNSVNARFSESFAASVRRLKTSAQSYDFKRNGNAAINNINRWAAESTRNAITEIIPRQFPIESVQILLSSAIYFQGIWKYKFNETSPNIFYNEDGQSVRVPFMEIRNAILINKFTRNRIEMQVIELPYEGDNYAMLIILPEERSTVNDIVRSFDSTFLSDITEAVSQNSPQRLTLTMPKFKISSTTRLRQILQSMQLVELFTPNANLPHLGTQSQVDEILHQGVLNVDENGTTAAAISTSFLIPLSADSVVNQKIVIDRPFLSLIVDKKNNIPLFVSKVNKLKNISN